MHRNKTSRTRHLDPLQEALFEAVDGRERKLRVDLGHFDVPARVVLPHLVAQQQTAQQHRSPGFGQERHVALFHEPLHVNEADDAALRAEPRLVEERGNEIINVRRGRRRVGLVHLGVARRAGAKMRKQAGADMQQQTKRTFEFLFLHDFGPKRRGKSLGIVPAQLVSLHLLHGVDGARSSERQPYEAHFVLRRGVVPLGKALGRGLVELPRLQGLGRLVPRTLPPPRAHLRHV